MAEQDLGRGRMAKARICIYDDSRPLLAAEPLLALKAVAPQHRLDVALAWWRNRNKKASVPEIVRMDLARKFHHVGMI